MKKAIYYGNQLLMGYFGVAKVSDCGKWIIFTNTYGNCVRATLNEISFIS